MVTASDGMTGRRQALSAALASELQRQDISGVDIDTLAEAVEIAITADAPVSEGRHPDQLNATNDD